MQAHPTPHVRLLEKIFGVFFFLTKDTFRLWHVVLGDSKGLGRQIVS